MKYGNSIAEDDGSYPAFPIVFSGAKMFVCRLGYWFYLHFFHPSNILALLLRMRSHWMVLFRGCFVSSFRTMSHSTPSLRPRCVFWARKQAIW